jgi:hypothetical protein
MFSSVYEVHLNDTSKRVVENQFKLIYPYRVLDAFGPLLNPDIWSRAFISLRCFVVVRIHLLHQRLV